MSADRTSQPQSIRRVVVASLIGTSLEWYDFFLYASVAGLVFNKLFFPNAEPLTGTLLAFATSPGSGSTSPSTPSPCSSSCT